MLRPFPTQDLPFDLPPYRPTYESMRLDAGIGLCGMHWVTQIMQLPAYRALRLNVVAASEADPDKRSKAGALGIVPVEIADDWRAVASHDGVSVLDCAFGHRPERQHARLEVLRAAGERGQAVLFHKPLASSLEVAEQLVREAQELGVTAAVNLNCRFNPANYAVKGLLDDARLGEPRVIELTSSWRHDIRPVERFAYATISHTIHHADLLRWWVGHPCVEVYAKARNGVTLATYTFANGTIAHHVEHHNGEDRHRQTFRLLTGKGLIHGSHNWVWHRPSAEAEDAVRVWLDTNRRPVDVPLPIHVYEPVWSLINPYIPHEGPYYDVAAPVAGMAGTMSELMDAHATGRTPSHSLDQGLHSLRMAIAAVVSAREGRPIDPSSLEATPEIFR
jgi:predicted dehydrogenase